MLEGFKAWFNGLSNGKKIAFVIGIIVVVAIIIVGIILLIVKLTKKQEESFSSSNTYPNETVKSDVGSIAEAYTAAWIASLKS